MPYTEWFLSPRAALAHSAAAVRSDVRFRVCGLYSSEIEIVVNRECNNLTNQSQEANVIPAITNSRLSRHAQSAQAPVQRQHHENSDSRRGRNHTAGAYYSPVDWVRTAAGTIRWNSSSFYSE